MTPRILALYFGLITSLDSKGSIASTFVIKYEVYDGSLVTFKRYSTLFFPL